ncbi:MAG: NfeD family protein [Pseudomonadota bacterium]
MVGEYFNSLGSWNWLLLGFLLLGLEMIIPGVLLMWLGFAALVIGGLSLVPFADIASWTWQVQTIAFGILSAVLAYAGTRMFPPTGHDGKKDRFADPLTRFTGAETELLDEGSSEIDRVQLGDTIWRVRKTGLPAGSKVRVIGNEDGVLLVEPAQPKSS